MPKASFVLTANELINLLSMVVFQLAIALTLQLGLPNEVLDHSRWRNVQ